MSWLPAEADQVCLTVNGEAIFPCVTVAKTFGQRGIGLMGRKQVPKAWGQGLLFPNCRSLHTCFMRFRLNIAFLDAEGVVLKVCEDVKPWRVCSGPKGTVYSVEWVGKSFLGEGSAAVPAAIREVDLTEDVAG